MSAIDIDVAEDLRHALELLANSGPDTRPVAGATDVILRLHLGKLAARRLVSIAEVSELAFVRETNGQVRLGANTLVTDLLTHPLVVREYPCLVRCAREFASPQIRNRATIGGNIANASPAADTVPALIALGAEVSLRSARRDRRMPLDELFTGPGRTQAEADELITEVTLPRRADTFQAFAKFGNRAANVIAIVNMAMCLRFDGARIAEARVAYGSCAPVPLRARAVEAHLTGRPLDQALVASVGDAVRRDVKPISDVRGSREYKETLAVNATEDALREALEGLLGRAGAARA